MVVDGRLVFAWLGLSAFIVTASTLICTTGTPGAESGNLFDIIVGFLTFSPTCDGGLSWVATLLISLIVYVPGLFILASLLIPVLAGVSSNSIVGTIVSIAVIVAFVALITTWVT